MPKNFLEKICKRELKSSAVLFSAISRNKSVNDVEYNDSIFKKAQSTQKSYHAVLYLNECI